MRSIAVMSPDVGRAMNLSGPSMAKSAGFPELPLWVGAPDGGGPEAGAEAQAARARERKRAFSVEAVTGSSDAPKARVGCGRDQTLSTAIFLALTNETTAIVDNTTVNPENAIGAPKRKNQPTISSPMHASCNVTANGRALRGSRRLSVPSCHARTVMSNISTVIVIAKPR